MKIKLNSWDVISINDYYRIVDICEDDTLSEAEKDIALIAVCCGVDEEEIWGLPVSEVRELRNGISFLGTFNFNQKAKFNKIKIGNEEYEVNTDISKMNMEQYVDFQICWGKNDLRTQYGYVLACFIIPKGKKYNEGYDVVSLADKFRDEINIKLANEICFFFLKEWLNSIRATQMYSEWTLKKMMRKEKNPVVKTKLGRVIIMQRERMSLLLGSVQLMQYQKEQENLLARFGK